ncbi:hypothetical protein [Halopelagius longus]|uniref:DUF8108 domain-containing protein n=1 Tax=Halopelagius longus TaxID=1236180 RepID=A0A1H1G7M2_9EURY|nr:hypothetical protein [Halopelagius longus]RDI69792.1 hypothetical protein DWB78_16715 [Halopelagius longus]SDR09200.1 hypothetical protein SAMN05216278_3573 [Halopelagius longus]
MTDDTTTYDGDVTLNGSERPPVELLDPADVFVTTNSVGGDFAVRNAEYVFTHQSIDVERPDERGDAETTIGGSLEDGYVEQVDGDVVVTDAEDVFVAAEAAEGEFSAPGAENVYADDVSPTASPEEYDVSTVGWRQSATATDPTTGVYAVGMDHEIELTKARRNLELYLVGHGHDVRVEGRDADVTVHFVGYDNTVRVGPYLSADVASETGFDNEIDAAPYPAEDLVEMSRSEAYSNAGFGRRKVTFQEPTDDEEWCPNCGQAADAVIERHQMEAFFLFGYPVWTYDRSTNPACECEHCSPNAVHAELSPEERRSVLD